MMDRRHFSAALLAALASAAALAPPDRTAELQHWCARWWCSSARSIALSMIGT